MEKADLLKMKLHEIVEIKYCVNILRVPGGWIYSMPTGQHEENLDGSFIQIFQHVFVPEEKEGDTFSHKGHELPKKIK